jgi:aldehyde:ferredoxin oxidoreductase
MPNGYMGKILWVNLTDGTFKEEVVPDEVYRLFLGGYGLAAKLIYENLPKKVDPLSSEAILGFFPGLLTGTLAPLTGRYMVAGKSPLTGTWGDSHCGGFFGPEIRKCGFDGILIKGKAKGPKILTMINNERQLIDGTDIWGLDTVETENMLLEKYESAKIASIGVAAEKLSLISGIVNDKGRIAARSGLGAVMGSKHLKAIVLKGSQKIQVADKDTLIKLVKEYNTAISSATTGPTQLWKKFGTSWMNNSMMPIAGVVPIKNWGGSCAEDYPPEKLEKVSGEELNKFKEREFGCFGCPVRCGAILKATELGIEETHRPEFETFGSLGPLLLNDNLLSIIEVNDLCNRGGIDTISVGGTVAYAMECFEKGLLTKDDLDGLELDWGNSKAITKLVKKIIKRDGIGDLLADGCKIASERLGKGEEYSIHSMGQELPMQSSKFHKSIGMWYAFDPTPGRHTSGNLDLLAANISLLAKPFGLFEGFRLPKKFSRPGEARNKAFKIVSALWHATSCIGICEFAYHFQQYPLVELIKSILGWDITMDEIVKVGMRIQTLRQVFNIREGIDISKNRLPERAVKGDYVADYRGYCESFGWNPNNGHPFKETLSDLGLDSVIKDIY